MAPTSASAMSIAADLRLAAIPPHVAAVRDLVHVIFDACRRARAGLRNLALSMVRKYRRAARRPAAASRRHKHARGLRHAFDHQHAGHDRIVGKMPTNCGSLIVTFLMPMRVLVAAHVDDAVDHTGTDSDAAAAAGSRWMPAASSVSPLIASSSSRFAAGRARELPQRRRSAFMPVTRRLRRVSRPSARRPGCRT